MTKNFHHRFFLLALTLGLSPVLGFATNLKEVEDAIESYLCRAVYEQAASEMKPDEKKNPLAVEEMAPTQSLRDIAITDWSADEQKLYKSCAAREADFLNYEESEHSAALALAIAQLASPRLINEVTLSLGVAFSDSSTFPRAPSRKRALIDRLYKDLGKALSSDLAVQQNAALTGAGNYVSSELLFTAVQFASIYGASRVALAGANWAVKKPLFRWVGSLEMPLLKSASSRAAKLSLDLQSQNPKLINVWNQLRVKTLALKGQSDASLRRIFVESINAQRFPRLSRWAAEGAYVGTASLLASGVSLFIKGLQDNYLDPVALQRGVHSATLDQYKAGHLETVVINQRAKLEHAPKISYPQKIELEKQKNRLKIQLADLTYLSEQSDGLALDFPKPILEDFAKALEQLDLEISQAPSAPPSAAPQKAEKTPLKAKSSKAPAKKSK